MKRQRSSRWDKYSELELLNMLKEEIIRIGIVEHPSKTDYTKLYDNSKSMSAQSYINRFNKTWEELMKTIGVEYDKKSIYVERGSKGGRMNKAKSYETKWTALDDEQLLSFVSEIVLKNGVKTLSDYNEKRDRDDSPSPAYLRDRLGNWKPMITRIYAQK